MSHRDQFVRIAGEPVGFATERNPDPKRIDHVSIFVRASRFGVLHVTVNTLSLRNRDLGLDSRIYVGILETAWTQLPAADVVRSEPFDYATIVAPAAIRFQPYEQRALENMLEERVSQALFIEGWGEFMCAGIREFTKCIAAARARRSRPITSGKTVRCGFISKRAARR